MPRAKTTPQPDEPIRLNFWCSRGLVERYKEALAARASTLSLDLRQHMGRVVAEHQAAEAAAAKKG